MTYSSRSCSMCKNSNRRNGFTAYCKLSRVRVSNGCADFCFNYLSQKRFYIPPRLTVQYCLL